MARVYAIQAAPTTWDEQSRVEGAAGSSLTEQARSRVLQAAAEMPREDIQAVHACTTGEAERQTAELVAGALGVKVREAGDLHELDYGLWQGLTAGEIKHRQGRAYRQWLKAPASLRPPEGETVGEARQRLALALKAVLKRRKNGSPLLVLRPVLMGLLKCLAGGRDAAELWQYVDLSFSWGCYEVDTESL